MTENEAIKELETSIDLAKMCTQNYERKNEIQGYEMAIKAVFEWFMHKHEQNCPDGEYQIRFPGIPYVLTMKKEEKGGTDAEH
nr:MAG TPA: hypothetical protein [Caudoviricetes sp.]